jgi:uncharacterized membrane protein YedE/YeeE
MKTRGVATLFGGLFGFLLTWGQFEDPARIREMLLLEDPYLYLMMLSAIAVGMAGIWVLRRRRARSPLTGRPIVLERSRPERRHIVGAATFGLGWAITASCPAPIASQLALGVGWSLFTIAGVFLGIELYLRRRGTAPVRSRAGEGGAAISAPPSSA